MEQKNNRISKSSFLVYCGICVLLAVLSPVESSAEEAPVMQWTAANMLPVESGISVLRYSSFGLGAYPWRNSLPGSIVRVRIDGVPLFGLSPFGPDLDLIPAAFVDSIGIESPGLVTLHTQDIKSDTPVTRTDFLLGEKRRFRFQATFKKKLSAASGILLGGTSSGIHGSEMTESSDFRNYIAKYQRSFAHGGKMFFSIRALRDRDGLRESGKPAHMGDRETDMTALSLGVCNLALTQLTSISPVIYYQSGISRFRRYELRKSLDDDAFGFAVKSSTRRGNTFFNVTLSSDSRVIDSRLHDKKWNRNNTQASVSWGWASDRLSYRLNAGIVRSSEYGTGGNGEGKIAFQATPSIELSVRGAVTDEVPDAGMEFYPALVFSDSTDVSELDMCRFRELESGLAMKRGVLSWGMFYFQSRGKMPVIDPVKFQSIMGNNETFSGVRFFMTAHEDDRYHTDVQVYYTDSSNSGNILPYPGFELLSQSHLSKKFFRESLNSSIFYTLRVSNWSNKSVTSDDTVFFLDCGVSFTVMKMTIFYMLENITGEDVRWFDALGRTGLNSIWGIRWKFEN